MNKLYQIFSFTFLVSICVGSENNINKTYNGFEVSSVLNEKRLRFKNLDYELKQLDLNGTNYVKPTIKDAGSAAQPGEPFLPTVTTMYAVNPGKKMNAELIVHEKEVIQNVDILPLEGWGRNLSGNPVKGIV